MQSGVDARGAVPSELDTDDVAESLRVDGREQLQLEVTRVVEGRGSLALIDDRIVIRVIERQRNRDGRGCTRDRYFDINSRSKAAEGTEVLAGAEQASQSVAESNRRSEGHAVVKMTVRSRGGGWIHGEGGRDERNRQIDEGGPCAANDAEHGG